MFPDWKLKNNHADISWKEILSIITTFDPVKLGWDVPSKTEIIN
jgi:hypothetical protein